MDMQIVKDLGEFLTQLQEWVFAARQEKTVEQITRNHITNPKIVEALSREWGKGEVGS